MGASIGGSKSSKTTTQNQNTVNAPANQPYLLAGADYASKLLGAGGGQDSPVQENLAYNGLQDATTAAANARNVAGSAQETADAGLGDANAFANGLYVNNPGNQYLTGSADGSYLSSGNPQFQGMVTRIAQSLEPQIDGNAAAAGRYGSGANANAFASALTNETGNLAYQNYNDERGRQLQAAQDISQNYTAGRGQQLQNEALLPSVTQNAFTPAAALGGAASGEEGMAYAPLQNYQGIVSEGNFGGDIGTTGATKSTGYNLNASAGAGTGGGGGTPFPG